MIRTMVRQRYNVYLSEPICFDIVKALAALPLVGVEREDGVQQALEIAQTALEFANTFPKSLDPAGVLLTGLNAVDQALALPKHTGQPQSAKEIVSEAAVALLNAANVLDDCEAHEACAKANTVHEKLCAWLESASTPFPINGTERSRDP